MRFVNTYIFRAYVHQQWPKHRKPVTNSDIFLSGLANMKLEWAVLDKSANAAARVIENSTWR